MTIKIAQDVERIRGDKYWRWSVWLDAPEEELKSVEWVLWKLDPSFSPSQVRVDTRSDGFRLRNSGWGEFEIEAEIHRPDGVTSLRHRLQFEGTQPHHPKLFISYRQADARLARLLTDILRKEHEFTVLLDIDVPPGEDFRRWLTEKLDESDAMVVLQSPSSVRDLKSLGFELGYLSARQSADKRIIPKILVGETETQDLERFFNPQDQVVVIRTHANMSATEIAGRIKEIVDRRLW